MNSRPSRILIACLAVALSAGAPAPAAADSAVPALMNLLKSGRLPAERVGTVIELVCKQGNAEDLGYVLEQALEPGALTDGARLIALENLAAATVSRKVKPQGNFAKLAGLIVPDAPKEQRRLQMAAIRLCGLWKVKEASAGLQQVALNRETDLDVRRTALDSLMSLGGPAARETAEKLAGPEFSNPLRYLAVAGMTALDLDRASELAVDVLKETTADDDPAPLMAAFLDRRTGPDKLAAAIAEAEIPADAARLCLRYMYSVGRSDAALSAALSKAAGIGGESKPLSEEEIEQLTLEVLSTGDPQRGEEVFRRADVSCLKCHAVSKAGGDVGPDLSALGSSSPVDYVLKSILLPNQAIKEEYRSAVVITLEGKVHTGIVKERNDERIVLKEATGQERIVATADIDEEVQGQSLMPQGLAQFLTRRELIDLVRFLSELGKPGPYAIGGTPTIQRWRALHPVPPELSEAVPDDAAFRETLLENAALQWTPAYGKVGGALPLDEIARASRSSVVYVQGEVDVTETGRVLFRFDSAEGVHTWVDDQAFGSAASIETNLSRGRHTLTLRVDAGERESSELRVEVVKAEGSAAEFTVVGGR